MDDSKRSYIPFLLTTLQHMYVESERKKGRCGFRVERSLTNRRCGSIEFFFENLEPERVTADSHSLYSIGF